MINFFPSQQNNFSFLYRVAASAFSFHFFIKPVLRLPYRYTSENAAAQRVRRRAMRGIILADLRGGHRYSASIKESQLGR
jgi:hypothetical protein